ncbi:MAG: hypothetical protein ABI342_00445 [Nitrososphaera sp.]|jgi:hypothetical protein
MNRLLTTSFFAILFFSLVMSASAISISSVNLDENGSLVIVPSGSPAIVSLKSGFLHGTITIQGEPQQITSNLKNFVHQETRMSDGTFNTEFDGILENQTSTINIVQDGSVVYSLILEPQQAVTKSNSDTAFVIPTGVYVAGAVGGCIVIGIVWWKRQGEAD